VADASNTSAERLCAAADRAVIETPEGATAFVDALLSYVVYTCEFNRDGSRRPAWMRERELRKEAAKFESGSGWRGGNPALAAECARALHQKAAEIQPRKRGKPRKEEYAPARALLESVIAQLSAGLVARGRSDMAETILKPGKTPEGGERGTPNGISVATVVAQVMAERYGLPITKADLDRAANDLRRTRRHKRMTAANAGSGEGFCAIILPVRLTER
jgi:hypothetical protein